VPNTFPFVSKGILDRISTALILALRSLSERLFLVIHNQEAIKHCNVLQSIHLGSGGSSLCTAAPAAIYSEQKAFQHKLNTLTYAFYLGQFFIL